MTTARSQAARIIAEVLAGQSLNSAFDRGVASLADRERPLCRELVYGALREWPWIDGLLKQLLKKPLKDKDRDLLALLGIGIYQLHAMRVPAHAAVSETVATVAPLGKGWARGLVNGVLRNYQRQAGSLADNLDDAAAAALPDWLYRALEQQWPAQLGAVADAARQQPPMHLRVNCQRTNRDSALVALANADIPAQPHPTVESAIILDHGVDVSALPGFADGQLSVQDASAQLAALLLAPTTGESVLDACAAPGGKACHLAELAADANITASDSDSERLQRVIANRERLQLELAIVQSDARKPDSAFANQLFDAILADVPCSATGVMRRHPDVKVIRRADDSTRFAALQREILSGLWPRLKPGGRLLYATCSLLQEENDAVIAWAMAELPGVQNITISHPHAQATKYGVQCLPSQNAGDGLFYSLLKKT